MGDLHPSDTLANLDKAFPIGIRVGVDRPVPRDSYTGQRTVIRIKPAGAVGYPTPWSLTRRTFAGQRYYEAIWLDTDNRAWFKKKSDAADFLDLHRYAEGVRRITGQLPAWATTG